MNIHAEVWTQIHTTYVANSLWDYFYKECLKKINI